MDHREDGSNHMTASGLLNTPKEFLDACNELMDRASTLRGQGRIKEAGEVLAQADINYRCAMRLMRSGRWGLEAVN